MTRRQLLERRLAELAEEIRSYPRPIARCDEQLTELLERRAEVLAQLNEAAAQPASTGCSAEAVWINDGGFHAA
jgi:hypothetical protein